MVVSPKLQEHDSQTLQAERWRQKGICAEDVHRAHLGQDTGAPPTFSGIPAIILTPRRLLLITSVNEAQLHSSPSGPQSKCKPRDQVVVEWR